LRRPFPAADAVKGRLMLRIHHDEDATVFLNGLKIAELAGYTQDYFDLPLEAAAAAALKKGGDNVLAVRCIQTRGGQFIDAGLADEVRLDD